MGGEIVVGYDGTDCAKAALDAVCELAADTGATVVVGYGFMPYQGAGEIGTHKAILRELGEKAVAEAVAVAKERGVEAEAVLVEDRPAHALAQLADQRQARLVAVGTYGEHPIKGAILGSTPHKLLYMSSVPVLVVPAE